MTEKTDTAAETKVETKDPAKELKAKLLTLLITETPSLVEKYAKLIKYTGSLLSTSMTIAYSKGLSDAAKLINKETNE
jgi:hypothetical protein